MTRPSLRLATPLAAAGLLLAAAGPAPRADPTACALAAELVRMTLDEASAYQPIVYTDQPQTQSFGLQGWDEGPRRDLVTAFRAGPRDSAVARCPEVRTLLTRRGVGYGAAAVAKMQANPPPRRLTPAVHAVSLPVVSRDGRQALVETAVRYGGVGGSSFVAFYSREQAGRWRQVVVASVAIS